MRSHAFTSGIERQDYSVPLHNWLQLGANSESMIGPQLIIRSSHCLASTVTVKGLQTLSGRVDLNVLISPSELSTLLNFT